MSTDTSIDGRNLAELFPAEVHGWRPDGPDGLYDAETLYDLIDGGAEVYIALNVKAVASRRYVKADAAEIIADIFDMGSSADAFGAYQHDLREGEDAGIGRESEFLGSSLAFWKDRYFVSIVAFEDAPAVAEAVREIGRAIVAGIAGDGPPPDLAAWLPQANLVTGTVHYFHDWMLFNCYYKFDAAAGENPLRLGRDTEGVIARYTVDRPQPEGGNQPDPGAPAARGKPAPHQSALIVIRYPSPEHAASARRQFLGAVVQGDGGTGRMKSGDRACWGGARQEDNVLVAAACAPTADAAGELMRAVKKPGPVGGAAPEAKDDRQ